MAYLGLMPLLTELEEVQEGGSSYKYFAPSGASDVSEPAESRHLSKLRYIKLGDSFHKDPVRGNGDRTLLMSTR